MHITDLFKFAAAALHQLYEARSAAMHTPLGYPERDHARIHAEARAQVIKYRDLVVQLLRAGAFLALNLPALPEGYELPEWPWVVRNRRSAADLGVIADIVGVGAESMDDDLRYKHELLAWCREYSILATELDLPMAGALPAEVVASEVRDIADELHSFIPRMTKRLSDAGIVYISPGGS